MTKLKTYNKQRISVFYSIILKGLCHPFVSSNNKMFVVTFHYRLSQSWLSCAVIVTLISGEWRMIYCCRKAAYTSPNTGTVAHVSHFISFVSVNKIVVLTPCEFLGLTNDSARLKMIFAYTWKTLFSYFGPHSVCYPKKNRERYLEGMWELYWLDWKTEDVSRCC